MSDKGFSANEKELQERRFNLREYRKFVADLIATLNLGARTIVKFVAFPEGTFGLNAVLAATGESEKYRIELVEGACPHCLILGTLGDMARALGIDEAMINRAGGQYLDFVRSGTLPELYIMHRQTLQGEGGRILGRIFTTPWGTNCTAAHVQPERTPFTGNCPRHAYNGR